VPQTALAGWFLGVWAWVNLSCGVRFRLVQNIAIIVCIKSSLSKENPLLNIFI
jgi:hypothetical protein